MGLSPVLRLTSIPRTKMTEHEPINLEDFIDDLTMESGKRMFRDGRGPVVRREEAEKEQTEATRKEKDTLDLLG